MRRRVEEAFRRAASVPLPEPPPLPEGASYEERQEHTVKLLAHGMAKKAHQWADTVLGAGHQWNEPEC